MPTMYDPFDQARAEVANKSWTTQVWHSRALHSFRSATKSKGSFFSKVTSAGLSIGKTALNYIPIPVVGSVVGAILEKGNEIVRAKLHEKHFKHGTFPYSLEERAEDIKFRIKELTVENLDRYRWKLADAYGELNKSITTYNQASRDNGGGLPGCDHIYQFALAYQQVERRKDKLKDELGQFRLILESVEMWIAEVEATQVKQAEEIKEEVRSSIRQHATSLTDALRRDPALYASFMSDYWREHAACGDWCFCKGPRGYTPNPTLGDVKTRFGDLVTALAPVAVSSISLKGSDYKKG